MILPALLLAAAAAAAPAPQRDEPKLYSDWTAGCDNGRACQAVGLMPEGMPEEAATMLVRRGAEAGALPEIEIDVENGVGASLEADGRPLGVRLVGTVDAKVASADVAKVIAALRSARMLRIVGAGGKTLGTISLAGASAALLYMDDRQRRVGTVTALVRPGTKPASAVPPPPPIPIVRSPPFPAAPPVAVSRSRIAALRSESGCTIGDVGGPDEHEVTPLDATRSLVLLACGSGAYNVSYVPFVARRQAGQVRIALADFDVREPWWIEEKHPVLINASWDPARGVIATHSRARGLGDCGTFSEYAWDGARFRLVQESEMGECRGSMDYIPTWRARVVRP